MCLQGLDNCLLNVRDKPEKRHKKDLLSEDNNYVDNVRGV
jgi:hypothetical protein